MWNQTLRGARDALLGTQCHGCGTAGVMLCGDCRGLLRAPPREVFRSRRGLPLTFATVGYAGIGRGVVVGFKERQAWALGPDLAAAIARGCVAVMLAHDCRRVVLVPAPSSAASVRERGLDTTRHLARLATRVLGGWGLQAEVADMLAKRAGVADQAGLTAADRAANMHHRIRVRGKVPGLPVILVDDVVTTGATLCEARRALTGRATVLGAATVAARGWT